MGFVGQLFVVIEGEDFWCREHTLAMVLTGGRLDLDAHQF
jgi:hypothetical protein